MPAIPTPGKFWEDACVRAPDYDVWFRGFSSFLHLLDLDRDANAQLADKSKNAYLLLLLGTAGAAQFAPHPLAGLATTTTFANFSAAVRGTFVHPVSLVRARFDFCARRQEVSETAEEYAIELRRLAGQCKFRLEADEPALISSNIAVQLALGCRSPEAQRQLLAEEKPDLTKFLAILSADERSRIESAAIRGEPAPATIGALQKGAPWGSHRDRRGGESHDSRSGGEARNDDARPREFDGCRKCGCEHSDRKRCVAANATCQRCGVIGHFARVCRTRDPVFSKVPAKAVKGVRLGKISMVQRSQDDNAPLTCEVELKSRMGQGARSRAICLEVDTGAGASTLRASDFYRLCGRRPLRRPQRPLLNADGSRVTGVQGTFRTTAEYGGRVGYEEFYVVPNRCSSVMSRRLMRRLLIPCINEDLLESGESRSDAPVLPPVSQETTSGWFEVAPLTKPPTSPPATWTQEAPAAKVSLQAIAETDIGQTENQGDQLPVAVRVLALPDAVTQDARAIAGLFVDELRQATAVDEDLKEVGRYGRTRWPKHSKLSTRLRPYYPFRAALSNSEGYFIRNDTGANRVCVPSTLRSRLLSRAHLDCHGAASLKRLLRFDYWWPDQSSDIKAMAKGCDECKRLDKLAAVEDKQADFWTEQPAPSTS